MKENDIIFKYESTEGMENYRNSSHMSKYIKHFLIFQSFEKNIESVVRENDKVKIFEKPFSYIKEIRLTKIVKISFLMTLEINQRLEINPL